MIARSTGARALVMSPDGQAPVRRRSDADQRDPATRSRSSTRNKTTGALTFVGLQDDERRLRRSSATATNQGSSTTRSRSRSAPDGDEVFIAGENQSSIGSFARDAGTGELGTVRLPRRRSPGALTWSTRTRCCALRRLRSAATAGSSTPRHASGDAIAWFGYNNATGTLSYMDCVGATERGRLRLDRQQPRARRPASLVVSPDNGAAVRGGRDGNAIGTFVDQHERRRAGFAGCDGASQVHADCQRERGQRAGSARDLAQPAAVSTRPRRGATRSGSSLAASALTRSVSSAASAPTGPGPARTRRHGAAFSSPSALAASPDGRHLYGAAGGSGTRSRCSAVSPPACSPGHRADAVPDRDAGAAQLRRPRRRRPVQLRGRQTGERHAQRAHAGNSVLFTPNRRFSGQGIFDFTASDTDGSTPAPRDDRRRPAAGSRGGPNQLDPEPLRRSTGRTRGSSDARPAGCRATRRCRSAARRRSVSGSKACPFKRKSAKPKRHRATVDVKKRVSKKKTKLRVGVRLQIRITAPGAIGKVVNYKLRPKKLPRSTERCLAPGASKPRKRC